jgi:putative serine protease PepD
MSAQPPFPPPPTAPDGPFGYSQQPQTMSTPPPRPVGGRRFGALLVAAALVVGGAAGVGGAAAFTALDDDGNGSSSDSGTAPTASQVVNAPDSPAGDESVEQVAQSVLPSVVELDVEGSQGAGSGSGIIIDSSGLILTNNHVAEIAENGGRITVSFHDGTKADGEIVGTDPLTDTALVQAKDVEGLTPATIGKSANLDVGEQVVAVGSPYGLDATVTSGIVSALNRPVAVGQDAEGNSTTYPAIQTDAAINPGNSGGPLVDMQGRVVGINASIRTANTGSEGSIGLGFAIPIDEVLPIVEQMKDGETPTHARLGITVRNAADTTGAEITDGAEIQEITNGSAADDAGLEQGDVITKIDDHLVSSSDSLVATVRSYRPGDQVEVTYERDGDTNTTTLTLGSDADTSTS